MIQHVYGEKKGKEMNIDKICEQLTIDEKNASCKRNKIQINSL